MTDKGTPCNVASLKVELDGFRQLTEERFAHNKAMRETEAHALVIQAKEIERRLDALNGEQGRIAQSQATYVSRELWDKVQADDKVFRSRVEQFMAVNQGQRQGVGFSGTVIDRIVTLIIGVVIAYATFRALK